MKGASYGEEETNPNESHQSMYIQVIGHRMPLIEEKKLITNSKCQNGNANLIFVPCLALSNSVESRQGKWLLKV